MIYDVMIAIAVANEPLFKDAVVVVVVDSETNNNDDDNNNNNNNNNNNKSCLCISSRPGAARRASQ